MGLGWECKNGSKWEFISHFLVLAVFTVVYAKDIKLPDLRILVFGPLDFLLDAGNRERINFDRRFVLENL